MATIGRPIGVPGHTTQKLDAPDDLDTGTANSFTMKVGGVAVSPDEASLAVYVSNVRQIPGVAYTVSGSTLTFTGTVTTSNYSYAIVMGDAMYVEDNFINEAKLRVSNAPTNGQFLSAQSGDTGGLTWAAVTDTNDDVNIANLTARLPQITESVTIGDATDVTVTIAGGLVVNGTTTTVNSTTLQIDDKNIDLAHSPSGSEGADASVDGGGITLKSSDSDKTITWVNADDAWTFNQHIFPSTSTLDLGGASDPWRNIYTSDLHLTNERGSWTVIEEEDYLTLRNNKNDKVYKLVMEEIE